MGFPRRVGGVLMLGTRDSPGGPRSRGSARETATSVRSERTRQRICRGLFPGLRALKKNSAHHGWLRVASACEARTRRPGGRETAANDLARSPQPPFGCAPSFVDNQRRLAGSQATAP